MAKMLVQLVVGSAEELRGGQGETAVMSATAAARLGISLTRLRQLVDEGLISPCARFMGLYDLFCESDVEALKAAREKR